MDPENSSATPTMAKKDGQSLGELVRFFILTLAIVIPIRVFVAQPFVVNGASMFPTFSDSDYLIVDELSYLLRTPERGEVVIFRYPKDPKKFFIKRIIGLPGETIRIQNSVVTIVDADGQQEILPEPYISESFYADTEIKLGPGEYFVMGDNRNVSLDSRSWGPVTEELIKGRALIRLLPPNEISFLPGSLNKFSQ